ncbi:M24 family metallopeptidase [Nocardioides sp. NBC_00163]|uniref:M24 family metallopeptidase n=1 Tax=Nocardioides sp. NBC_00163 TaxID=2975999 RepID=UPI00324AE69C
MSVSPDLSTPTLSLAERDRRWGLLRDLMRRNEVEALLVPPAPVRYPADTYLTNDLPGSAVILPLEGEPVAIQRGASLAGSWLQAQELGEGTWIQDMRFGPRAPAMVRVLEELGLTKSRIGTIGILSGPNLLPYGWTPQPMWAYLQAELPQATFVDVLDEFTAVWLVKSDEELALFRFVSELAERACQVMLDVTKPGVSEIDVYAAILHEFHRHGAGMAHDLFLHSGPDNLSWDAPRWLHRAQPARVIQNGDMVLSEMMPAVGGIEAQVQMCVAVGDVAPEFHRAAEVARESYERGLEAIRPGVKFGEVADAMAEPLERAGAWHITPLIHSLTPLTMVGRVTRGTDRSITDRFKQVVELPGTDLDVVLEPGMTFQLEPDAVFGRQQVNIGGNVIVTTDGYEELNTLPTRLRFANS